MPASILNKLSTAAEICYISVKTWYQVWESHEIGSTLRYTVPDRGVAEQLAKGLGTYGNDGRIEVVKYLSIVLPQEPGQTYLVPADPPVNAEEVERSILRAQAVSKLTPAELNALLSQKR